MGPSIERIGIVSDLSMRKGMVIGRQLEDPGVFYTPSPLGGARWWV